MMRTMRMKMMKTQVLLTTSLCSSSSNILAFTTSQYGW